MSTGAVVVVVAVLAVIAFVALRATSARRNEWDTAPAALGMQPVSALDPSLSAAIIALHRPPVANPTFKQTWTLTHIYRVPEPGVACYSATAHLDETGEIWEHGKTIQTRSSETRLVAIVAPETVQAPRMKLAPRAETSAAAGGLASRLVEAANAMTDTAAEHDGTRVEFADDPAFDQRYLVLSPQPDRTRAFLDPARRQKLSSLDAVQISLDGSLILVSSPTDPIRHRGWPLQQSLTAELENARRVLAVVGAAR